LSSSVTDISNPDRYLLTPKLAKMVFRFLPGCF